MEVKHKSVKIYEYVHALGMQFRPGKWARTTLLRVRTYVLLLSLLSLLLSLSLF